MQDVKIRFQQQYRPDIIRNIILRITNLRDGYWFSINTLDNTSNKSVQKKIQKT